MTSLIEAKYSILLFMLKYNMYNSLSTSNGTYLNVLAYIDDSSKNSLIYDSKSSDIVSEAEITASE